MACSAFGGKKQDFSFFRTATFRDVENIMTDQNIKEVYFLGMEIHTLLNYTLERFCIIVILTIRSTLKIMFIRYIVVPSMGKVLSTILSRAE